MSKKNEQTTIKKSLGSFSKVVDVICQRWAEFVHGEGCEWATLTPEVGA